jgi:hypothetical protein
MVDLDNFTGLLVAGLSASGGILIAQTVADRVLPALGINADPSSLVGAVGSAGVKGVVAVAAGYAAAQVSGMGQVLAAFIAVGALTAASTDVLEQFLSLPQLAGRRQTLAAANQNTGGTVRKVSSSGTQTRGTSQTTARTSGMMNDDMMMDDDTMQADEVVEVDSNNGNTQEFRQTDDEIQFRSSAQA